MKVQITGPKLTAKQWALTLAYVVLALVFSFALFAYLLVLLPERMFQAATMVVFGVASVILEVVLQRRRPGRGTLGFVGYCGAVFAISGAIVLGTLTNSELTAQQHTVIRVLWILVTLGIPVAWWFSTLERGESQVRSSPTV